ncbi:MAG: FAD-dependent oxidoreductase [Armatimonadota bacterium]|nr:FAD-dependent oxidoreductase [Armatimonadota bacterium]
MQALPEEAQAVVIGGGIVGCSVAYHLAELGWRDVVLVDKADLTSGSTWHAAGLVGQLRASLSLTRIMMYSVELYRRLAAETGHDPEWRQVGSLRLASSPLRMEENLRQAALARTFGLPVEVLGPRETLALCPLLSARDLVGAVYMPTDGRVDGSGVTFALAKGARARGVRICTDTPVRSITVRRGRVEAVVTDRGTIRTPVVVNAAGMWADRVGRLAGVRVPIVPMQHQYLLTEPIEGTSREMPVVRDPDLRLYFREEVRGLLVGGFEGDPAPWATDGVPDQFAHRLLPTNWPIFEPIVRNAARRVPAFEHAQISKVVNGPEAFTPDGEFIMGEAPGIRGLFVAAGFCAYGIAAGGGVGQVLAEWIVDGQPSLDVWRMDIRRFGPQVAEPAHLVARSVEAYARRYGAVALPFDEWASGRNFRHSPVHPRLVALGAVFGEKGGWERPNWFACNLPHGEAVSDGAAVGRSAAGGDGDTAGGATRHAAQEWRPRGWFRHNWSPAIGVEHRAVREAAGLCDFTSFSKFEVTGPGALRLLQWLCDNDVDRPPGTVVYTQMLNARGGIECDLTVTRLGPDRFFIVTGSAFGVHDLDWITRHTPDDGSVAARDVTTEWACVGLWGPRARAILAQVTDADVSTAAFPYMTARELRVADRPVRAQRVTYVGELGWELYMPPSDAVAVWDALWAVGQPFGLRAVGYRAVESLRLEKGYRYWSAEVTPEYTPYEAGQGFCVKLDKGPFQGREALWAQRAAGVRRRLCCLVVADPQAVALGNEPVCDGDRVISRVTSGGYGYTVGESLAYAYLPVALAAVGTPLAVEIDGDRVPATVAREPRYDPGHSRIRA